MRLPPIGSVGGSRRAVTRRERWRPVLIAEVKRWSAKSCEQLISELSDGQVYEVEAGSKKLQVEVELLENTENYVHVMVAVDDGTLPASLFPLTERFLRYKNALADERRI